MLREVQDLVETSVLQDNVVIQVHLEQLEPLVLEVMLDPRDSRVR